MGIRVEPKSSFIFLFPTIFSKVSEDGYLEKWLVQNIGKWNFQWRDEFETSFGWSFLVALKKL